MTGGRVYLREWQVGELTLVCGRCESCATRVKGGKADLRVWQVVELACMASRRADLSV